MKPVFFHAAVEIELLESALFYERRLPGLGVEFESAARRAVETIQSAPDRFPPAVHHTRRFVMRRFPFVIYYMDMPGAVWIIAFAHTSRKPGYWRRRSTAPSDFED